MNAIKSFYNFIADIIKNKGMLWGLARNDFKARFASSILGMVWAFVMPLITILVFWFVFQVGFKTPPVQDVPFIIWYIPAFLIWSFFTDCLMSVTNSLLEYGYLVKKVNFRVSMIPLVKIISSSFVHIVFLFFILFMCQVYKIPASIYNLQVLYYFFCTIVLLMGLGWLLSSIALFASDTMNLVSVAIQLGFWATPIFWSPDTMSKGVQTVLKLNPMYYIVTGYRDSFIDNIWFWERLPTTIYFWTLTLFIFVLGAVVFKKLRPHFADVL